MKKYLYSALALPLLFACSSEDFDEKVVGNDPFAGIAKVEATFSMDEGATTRFDGGVWNTEEGDLWGFAWMGDGTNVAINGKAYQNHNLIQTNGIFTPQTAIYVGKYYIYRPYDKTTVSPQAINFKSLEEQPLAEGYESHSGEATPSAFKDLAKTAINIGDKWTNVTTTGTTISGKTWNKAGIKEHYEIYAALFSNQTGLDLTYQKNNPTFAAAATIAGATDINYTCAAGSSVGAADIYEVTVGLAGAAKSFTYAPTVEPNGAAHSGSYWADKDGTTGGGVEASDGFGFTPGVITLTNEDGVSTGDNGSKGWFWFNSLPVSAGTGATGTAVQAVLTTTYGVVTVNSTVGACASVFEKYNAAATSPEWIKLNGTADKATPANAKEWNLDGGTHNTFVNQYGNHKGKYALTVDFSKGVMTGMHIKDDNHLQKLLKYYIASGKSLIETSVVLNLDGASSTDKTFKLSKNSIALLQTINAGGANNVKVQPCGSHNNPVKIIVTQEGSTGKTEVPDLQNVFATATDVYLSKDDTWTWKQRTAPANWVTVDAGVNSLTNEGTLTVNADNIQLSTGINITNAAGATMNITKVTTVKNALTNLGTINVGSESNTSAELRAYGIAITNDATTLDDHGVINNYGVVGVTDGVPGGSFNNYGLITMENDGAITLLTTNQMGAFNTAFAAGANMMGTVVLPENNPTALVSVNNAAANGFIKYNWTGATYATPAGNVKYNTIVVSNDIAFTASAPEIQYIEFNGTRTQVVNPDSSDKLANLKGVIVNAGKSIIIEKGNILDTHVGGSAFLGAGATVYLGGTFTHNTTVVSGTTVRNYFGNWETTQIVKY